MHTFAQKPQAPQQLTPVESNIRGRAPFGQSYKVDAIKGSPRAVGNQAAGRLLDANRRELKGNSIVTGIERFSHDFSLIPVRSDTAEKIQTKLSINEVGDRYRAGSRCRCRSGDADVRTGDSI